MADHQGLHGQALQDQHVLHGPPPHPALGAPPIPPPGAPPGPGLLNFIDQVFGEIRIGYGDFYIRINGVAVPIVASGVAYSLYRIFSRNPEQLIGKFLQGVGGAGQNVTIAALERGSILLNVLTKDKPSSLKLLQEYEAGEIEKRLKSIFNNFTIDQHKVNIESVKLETANVIPVKKDFVKLKEEADKMIQQLMSGKIPPSSIENKIEFCKNTDEPFVPFRIPEPRSNEVTLNGIPTGFAPAMAKDLVQQILNDPSSVSNVRYLRDSVIVMQLRTPQLVKELLADSPIKIGKKSSGLQTKESLQENLPTSTSTSYLPIKTSHMTVGAQEQQMLDSGMKSTSLQGGSKDRYQVQMFGVPRGFTLEDGRSLLQEILQDGSVVTNIEYLEKSVGPEKKNVIVAQMQTPERPKESSSSFEELWFVKPSFQRSLFNFDKAEGMKKQMMLVRQTPGMKQHLEEDVYVIEVHERST